MSSSEGELMTKAFYIEGHENEDYDLNSPPTSGLEYLRRVQQEARQCPNVVVAKIDPTHFSNKQTVKYNTGKGCLPAPSGYTPTVSWQKQQAAAFSTVRLAVTRHKMKLKKQGGVVTLPTNLPDSDDDAEWCRFCFGDKFQKNVAVNAKFCKAGQCLRDTTNSTGMPPLLSIVTAMSQPLIERVMEYHISWFEATGFTPEQGQWFYALLSSLEKPLTPEACALIRTLARQCANLRANLDNSDDQRLVHLNLLICLVSRYFDQCDLADEET